MERALPAIEKISVVGMTICHPCKRLGDDVRTYVFSDCAFWRATRDKQKLYLRRFYPSETSGGVELGNVIRSKHSTFAKSAWRSRAEEDMRCGRMFLAQNV